MMLLKILKRRKIESKTILIFTASSQGCKEFYRSVYRSLDHLPKFGFSEVISNSTSTALLFFRSNWRISFQVYTESRSIAVLFIIATLYVRPTSYIRAFAEVFDISSISVSVHWYWCHHLLAWNRSVSCCRIYAFIVTLLPQWLFPLTYFSSTGRATAVVNTVFALRTMPLVDGDTPCASIEEDLPGYVRPKKTNSSLLHSSSFQRRRDVLAYFLALIFIGQFVAVGEWYFCLLCWRAV